MMYDDHDTESVMPFLNNCDCLQQHGHIYNPHSRLCWENQLSDVRADLEAVTKERKENHAYMVRLFLLLAPQCEALPTVAGVTDQLDNYICGLKQQLAQVREELAQCKKNGVQS